MGEQYVTFVSEQKLIDVHIAFAGKNALRYETNIL